MSAAELTGTPSGLTGGSRAAARGADTAARTRVSSLLTGALLAVVLYAAFEHGAVALPAEARLQVVIAALAAAAGAAWLWTGTLRLAAPRVAIAGTALLAGFACWSGITVLWSVAPESDLDRAQPRDHVRARAGLAVASAPRTARDRSSSRPRGSSRSRWS